MPDATRPRRATVVAVALVAVALGTAAPAAADPAAPTNYRSDVTAVEPPLGEAARVEVVGGDAFLHLTVDPGHTALVRGYGRGGEDEEPYLRVEPDGTVLANLNSPAHYLNRERYGIDEVPARADVAAEPAWAPVAAGGTYTWHDHRIHWMSPTPPPAVRDRTDTVTEVFAWSVPLSVDGTDHTVRGRLLWLPDRSPALPVGLVVLAAGALVGLGLAGRRWATAVGAAWLGAASAGAVLVGEVLGAVQPHIGTYAGGVLLVVAVGAGGAASRSPRPRTTDGARLLAVSGLATAVLALQRVGVLLKPVVPSALSTTTALVLTALALAGGLAALGLQAGAAVGGSPPARDRVGG